MKTDKKPRQRQLVLTVPDHVYDFLKEEAEAQCIAVGTHVKLVLLAYVNNRKAETEIKGMGGETIGIRKL